MDISLGAFSRNVQSSAFLKDGRVISLSPEERVRGLDTVHHYVCGNILKHNAFVGLQLNLSVLQSHGCNLVCYLNIMLRIFIKKKVIFELPKSRRNEIFQIILQILSFFYQ